MPEDSTDSHAYAPEAFAKALAADEPLFLVGGQAVNLWGMYYWECTASLAPFVLLKLNG
ncbi:MAG: hypothetical protein ACOCWJ_05610 [Verrucomicrobiota bacterium]